MYVCMCVCTFLVVLNLWTKSLKELVEVTHDKLEESSSLKK